MMLDMNRNLRQHVWSHFPFRRRGGQAVKVSDKDQWRVSRCKHDEREEERVKTFFSLWRIFTHLFFWLFVLNEPPTFHIVCTPWMYFFFDSKSYLCVVLAKGMESVPERVKNVWWHRCSQWRVSDSTFNPIWQTVQLTAHWWPRQVYKKNRNNLRLSPGDAGVNFK